MTIPIPSRWRRAIALGLAWLPVGSPALAADPDTVWGPAGKPPPAASQRSARDIEIFHGTTKVYPVYRPKPTPVVPAEAKPWPGAPPYVPPPPTVHEDPRPVPPPPTEIYVRIEDRPAQVVTVPAPAAPAPQIVLAGYAMPMPQSGLFSGSAPWLTPTPPAPLFPAPPVEPAPAPTPPQPAPAPAPPPQTVVVIREPAGETRVVAPTSEQPRGVTLGTETLIGLGIGLVGVGFGFAGWRRRTAATAAGVALRHPNPPAPVSEDGLLLMGKYNAGPRRETVERFDLGLSYQAEQEQKKKTEAANQQAVVEFILAQNMTLHTDLYGPAEETELAMAEAADDPVPANRDKPETT